MSDQRLKQLEREYYQTGSDHDHAEWLRGVIRHGGVDRFCFELLARAERSGVGAVEVPVRWYHMDASQVRPLRHGIQMLRDAVRVRLWLWLGR